MSSLSDCVWQRRPLPLQGVVDVHAHMGAWLTFPIWGADADALVRQMDRVGVEKMICSHQAALSAEVVFGNDQVLEAMQRHPGRILGWAATFPVNRRLGIEEVRRCTERGMVGVKMHSINGIPYSSAAYGAIWEFAHEHQRPVLLHTWGSLEELEPLFERYADAPILLGHAGSSRPEQYAEYACRYPNVYLDICHSQSKYGLVEYFVREVGAGKVLFGSDTPWTSLAQQIGRVLFADITRADKEAILVQNPARILRGR